MIIGTLIFITLVISLMFLTITGGGLFPSTVGIVAIVTSVASGLVIFKYCRDTPFTSRGGGQEGAIPKLELTFGIILLFILITALPIPPALDSLSGSLRHQQNQAVVTAIHQASEHGAAPLLEDPWFCLSRNRAGTLRFFLLLAAGISACLLTSALPTKGKTGFLSFLAFFGTAVGIAGYLGQWKIPQGDTLWWVIPVPHAPTSPVGCFLNRNHFGGFVALLSPVALALAIHSFYSHRWFTGLFHLTLTTLMSGAVFMSLSRGAMLAMGAGLATVSLIIILRHRLLWGLILAAFIIATSGMWMSQKPVIRERLAGIHNPIKLDSVNSRLNEWRESLRVWPHYPIIGAGANALRMVYPQTRETSVGARLIHAENEYIQLLTECGVIGIGLAVAVALSLRRRMRQAATPLPEVIITSVLGALAVTATHCLFDFPAHHPLYALVLGSLVGLLIAPAPVANKASRWIALMPPGIALIGTLIITCFHAPDLKTMDDPNYLYQAKNRELHRALIWAPTSPAWLYLGRSMFKEGSITRNGHLCQQAELFMSRAAELDPKNYRLWYEVGQIRLDLKDHARAAEAFKNAQSLRSWMTPPTIPGSPTP